MSNWKKFIVSDEANIKEVLKQINDLGGKGLYVTDGNGKLIGSVTDGDLRRSLIKGIGVNENVKLAMKPDMVVVEKKLSDAKKGKILEKHKIQSVPVIDENFHIIDIFTIEQTKEHHDIQVVLMAGGMGTRLGKITENLPKPMIEVAGKPILERIINRLQNQGFSNFYLSVNYKAEIIENYFTDGKKIGCSINYIRENKRLGTAGPLSMLESNGSPIIVMNGDLLTHVDVTQLMNFHNNHQAKITMCIRSYEYQVPFGVIDIVDGMAKSFLEKPVQSFNVNAGIYVIEPEILPMIPKDEYYDMSTLLNALINSNKDIACFPIVEGWIDVGRESDLLHAQEIYSKAIE